MVNVDVMLDTVFAEINLAKTIYQDALKIATRAVKLVKKEYVTAKKI